VNLSGVVNDAFHLGVQNCSIAPVHHSRTMEATLQPVPKKVTKEAANEARIGYFI
jgi:hypothetical protein